MSFFGGNNAGNSWGGILKQAINSVENRLDQVLDIQGPEAPQRPSSGLDGPRRTRSTSNRLKGGPPTNPATPGGTPGARRQGRPVALPHPASALSSSASLGSEPMVARSQEHPRHTTPSPSPSLVAPDDIPRGRTQKLRAGALQSDRGPTRRSLDDRLQSVVQQQQQANSPTDSGEPLDLLSTPLSEGSSPAAELLLPRAATPVKSPRMERVSVDPLSSTEDAPGTVDTQTTASHRVSSTITSVRQLDSLNDDTTSSVGEDSESPADSPAPSGSATARPSVDYSRSSVSLSGVGVDSSRNSGTFSRISEDHTGEILEQREKQLISLNEQSSQVLEQLETTRTRLEIQEALAATKAKEHLEIQRLKAEEVERLQAEVDALKAAKGTPSDVTKLHKLVQQQKESLAERDSRVEQLIQEGGALSKKELRLSNTIKKLRADLAEGDKRQRELDAKLQQAQAKTDEWVKKYQSQLDQETRKNDQLKAHAGQIDRLNRTILDLQKQLKTAKEAQKNLQVALDASDQDVGRFKAKANQVQRDINAKVKEGEAVARRTFEEQIAEVNQSHDWQRQTWETLVEEKDQELARLRTESGEKERQLMAQISTLRMRLELAESNGNAFSLNIHEHTAPLFQQIEDLTNQLNQATQQRQTNERKLQSNLKRVTKRLAEREASLAELTGKLETLRSQLTDQQTTLAERNSQLDTLEADLAALETQWRTEQSRGAEQQARIDELEAELADRAAAQAELAAQPLLLYGSSPILSHRGSMSHTHHSRTTTPVLGPATSAEPSPSESIPSLTEAVPAEASPRLPTMKSPILFAALSPFMGPATPSAASAAGNTPNHLGSGSSRRGSLSFTASGSPRRGSVSTTPDLTAPVAGTISTNGVVPVVAHRQLLTQIASLQTQLQVTTHRRQQVEEELVGKTTEAEQLARENNRLQTAHTELTQLQTRHATVLELLGEKAEQVQELKADIADIKEAYKIQITELINKVEELSRR
ncbi:hypothetical protein H4R33_005494 [Dimargaris cristalligena]|nr:hypothetical protein H4R33_005494 [Dimargaris cristalligena]